MNKQQIERERKQVLIGKAISILAADGQDTTPVKIAKITGIPRTSITRMLPLETPTVAGLDRETGTYSMTSSSSLGVQTTFTESILGKIGVDISVGLVSSENIIPVMVGLLGKHLAAFNLIPDICNPAIYSEHVLTCLQKVSERGRLHSKHPSVQYLSNADYKGGFQLLFERTEGYLVGVKAFAYAITPLGETVLSAICDELGMLEFAVAAPIRDDYSVPTSKLRDIRPKDAFYLLSKCRGVFGGNYLITNNLIDRQFSRKYSLITSIGSATRDTNYNGYDISACLQSLVFQTLPTDYPKHRDYINNKKAIRIQLRADLDLTEKQVKTIISSADNGKTFKREGYCNKSEWLAEYVGESEALVLEYNQYVATNFPDVFIRAYEMAKPSIGQPNIKDIYSTFFFNWTQVERDIRDSMIDFAKAAVDVDFVHECHDAIYIDKKYDRLDIPALEQHIKATTGFDITID